MPAMLKKSCERLLKTAESKIFLECGGRASEAPVAAHDQATPVKGFSLVEVVMALGICGFCIVAIMGLLPTGIMANRDAVEQTAAAGMAAAVLADMRLQRLENPPPSRFGVPLNGTNPGASTQPIATLFISEDCNTTNSSANDESKYRIDVAYGERTSGSAPDPVQIAVSWPAAANKEKLVWPKNPGGRYEVFTVLER